MKVSEAIDRLAVGDTVWVKAEVNYKNKTESFPICCDLVTRSFWICDDDEISLSEPNSISDEKVLELVSTNFRFDKENFWNQLKEMDMLPQTEKVEVPDYVAEWYESHKDDLEDAISDQIDHGHDIVLDTRKDFDVWFFDESDHPIETLIRMKDGYTVKPKRWVVKQDGSEVWYLRGFGTNLDGEIIKRWSSHEGCIKFTDKSKAEAVATLVEGSVEEV